MLIDRGGLQNRRMRTQLTYEAMGSTHAWTYSVPGVTADDVKQSAHWTPEPMLAQHCNYPDQLRDC